MQGDKKSGLAAGLFALTRQVMCVSPAVSQSGTDASAGDMWKMFRWQDDFNFLKQPTSIGKDLL